MKVENKVEFVKEFSIFILLIFIGLYLVNREIKVNNMKKELSEINEMNDNLRNLNKDLELEINTVKDIIEELKNNQN